MGLFWLGLVLLLFVLSGLCMASGKDGRRRFVRGALSLMCLPVSTLITLLRRCR